MNFTVRTLRQAEREQNEILEYIAERSKAGAVARAKAFDKALTRLEESADTLPLAPENEHIKLEIRHILFKTRHGLVYRALFTIEGNQVSVLHIRGPGQDFLQADELGPPDAG